MAGSYKELSSQLERMQKEMEGLRAKAEKAKSAEVAEVIGKINEAIRAYGIRPTDLAFIGRGSPAGTPPRKTRGPGKKTLAQSKRPAVKRDVLRLPEVKGGVRDAEAAERAAAPARKKASHKSAGVKPMKYRDPHNPDNEWSGWAKKPAWFKAALDEGIQPEAMLIKGA